MERYVEIKAGVIVKNGDIILVPIWELDVKEYFDSMDRKTYYYYSYGDEKCSNVTDVLYDLYKKKIHFSYNVVQKLSPRFQINDIVYIGKYQTLSKTKIIDIKYTKKDIKILNVNRFDTFEDFIEENHWYFTEEQMKEIKENNHKFIKVEEYEPIYVFENGKKTSLIYHIYKIEGEKND